MFALIVAFGAVQIAVSPMGSAVACDPATMSPLPAVPFLPPPAPPAPPPRQGSSLVGLFSVDDYPTEALRREEEGLVIAEMEVSPNGRVASCQVVQSSNSRSLDEATCAIIARRARYRPARDEAGQAVTGHDKVRIKWLMPREPYRSVIELLQIRYKADGKLGECRSQASDNGPPPCRLIAEKVERMRADSGDKRMLKGQSLFIEHRVEIDGQSWAGANRQDGLVTLWQQVAEYRLGPDGKPVECRLISGPPANGVADLCKEPFDGPYEIDNSGAVRPLRSIWSLLAAR